MIIALNGYAGTGKNTVADYFTEKHGYKQLSFAAAIKKALWTLNPLVDYEQIHEKRLFESVESVTTVPLRVQDVVLNWESDEDWRRAKDNFLEIRRLLQVLGTEVGREQFGVNFWIDRAIGEIRESGRYVFTDLRFPNEYEILDNLGAVFVHIKRQGTEPVNEHPSENALDSHDFDVYIENDGTLEDLFRKLDRVLPRV